jgi:glutaredoxin
MQRTIQIILYTRHGCHLCEEVEAMLAKFAQRYALQITTIDIDTQPELIDKHGERVPVVMVNGKERFFGKVQAPLLQRVLQAEANA